LGWYHPERLWLHWFHYSQHKKTKINLPDDSSLRHIGYALDVGLSAHILVILFNLQSQVRFEGIHWALPLLPFRQGGECINKVRMALNLVATSAIMEFPQTILPTAIHVYTGGCSRHQSSSNGRACGWNFHGKVIEQV
jgi:hypothetical protein